MPTPVPPTYTEIADSLRFRISELAAGKIQSYSYAGRSFTYFNLRELVELEQTFRSMAYAETSGNGIVTLASVSMS